MSSFGTSRGRTRSAVPAVVVGVVAFIALLIVVGTLHSSFAKTQAGQVAVVRNGGPFDNNQIRSVLPPGSGLHWIGYRSKIHTYPSQQRFYTITADQGRGERTGVDVEHDPTSDGVEVGVEGTIYFTLNQDTDVLKRFDDKFGTRQYRGADGELRHAWEGEDGWNSFLDQIVRPVISNNFRETLGGYRCVDLLSSCVYVQNTGNAQNVQQILAGAKNNVNLSRVQTAVGDSLVRDVNGTLGGAFLTDIRVNLVRLSLPPELEKAVQDAQASFAAISSAQATVAKAQ